MNHPNHLSGGPKFWVAFRGNGYGPFETYLKAQSSVKWLTEQYGPSGLDHELHISFAEVEIGPDKKIVHHQGYPMPAVAKGWSCCRSCRTVNKEWADKNFYLGISYESHRKQRILEGINEEEGPPSWLKKKPYRRKNTRS